MESPSQNPSLRKQSRKRFLLIFLIPILTGSFVGTGSYTFMYANGASYLSNDPNACANCHVMNDHLSAWQKSSHHAVATCNDCHTPHGSLIGKYFVKSLNGWNHSLAFTTGNFPDEMRITDFNRSVTEGTCRHCHSDLTDSIHITMKSAEELSCLHCHNQVGHLE